MIEGEGENCFTVVSEKQIGNKNNQKLLEGFLMQEKCI